VSDVNRKHCFLIHSHLMIILFCQQTLNGAEGTVPPGRVYKKVAIVENFFDIIHAVHVDLEGRPGKHAGQKRTYRTVSCIGDSRRLRFPFASNFTTTGAATCQK
jgi:hypothetical protein